MTQKPITTGQDVVDYLEAQHEAIRALFVETLDAADADTKREKFTRLRTMLAVHETAEEMMVHPRVRRKIEGAGAVVDAIRHLQQLAGPYADPELARFTKRLVFLTDSTTVA